MPFVCFVIYGHCYLCDCVDSDDLVLTHLQTDNFSLIYGYDGSSFQRHYVNQGFEDRYPCLLFHLPSSFLLVFGAVLYVTLFFFSSSFFSKAHKYRLQCYYTEPGCLLILSPFFWHIVLICVYFDASWQTTASYLNFSIIMCSIRYPEWCN
jgi:hypothetical protein